MDFSSKQFETLDSARKMPWRGLLVLAAQLGAYAWTESQVSSMLGSVAMGLKDPVQKVRVNAQSSKHRWHSELFFDRLPVLSTVFPEEFVRAPNPEITAFLSLVGAAPSPFEQLIGLQLVLLPSLLTTYLEELTSLSEVADASSCRALRLVIADTQQEILDPSVDLERGSHLEAELQRVWQSSQGLNPLQIR
ncbi:MAG: hypothetical protein WCJ04_09320 [Actinomycetes bacterium]